MLRDWRDRNGNRQYMPWGGVQVCIYEANCPEARRLAEWLEDVCEKVIEKGSFDPLEEQRQQALEQFKDPALVALDMQRKMSTQILDLAIRQKQAEREISKIKENTSMAFEEAREAFTEAEGARADAKDAKNYATIANERVDILEHDLKKTKDEISNSISAYYRTDYSLTTQYIARHNLRIDEKTLGISAAKLAQKLGGVRTEEGWRGPGGEIWSYCVSAEGTRYSHLNRWADNILKRAAESLDESGNLELL